MRASVRWALRCARSSRHRRRVKFLGSVGDHGGVDRRGVPPFDAAESCTRQEGLRTLRAGQHDQGTPPSTSSGNAPPHGLHRLVGDAYATRDIGCPLARVGPGDGGVLLVGEGIAFGAHDGIVSRGNAAMKAARSRRHHRLQRRTITTTSTTGSAGSERSDTELSTFLPSTEGREQFRPSIAHHASHFSGLLPRSCVIEVPSVVTPGDAEPTIPPLRRQP